MQRVTNKQEQPPMKLVVQLELKESQSIDTTIWIVNNGSHYTMMFPNDY
ncbi:DUF960 family protein [Sporosarcina sp. A2]